MILAPDVKTALDGLNERRKAYASYQAWYDGEHDLRKILDRLPIRNVTFKDALCSLSENLCPLVVDAFADRLQLQGIDCPAFQDRAAETLDRWRIDAFQGEVHRQTATQGDGYVLVWAEPGQKANAWFHSGQEMTVVRSTSNPALLDMAIKQWDDPLTGNARLTIYYPDVVERYVQRGATKGSVGSIVGKVTTFFTNVGRNDWEPYTDDGAAVVRNPLGVVPVAVFNNARYRAFGKSEIKDAVGPQLMLNKSLVDLMLASEGAGMPTRYILGLDYSQDAETGKASPLFDPKEPVWALAGKASDISLGQFQAADLEKMARGSVSELRRIIARVTRTPGHYLGEDSGGWPSGEALKTAEAPFSQKVEQRQREWGEPWEDAVRFALMFDAGASLDTPLETKWKDTRPRHEYEYWQGQQIQSGLGKSDREIWREEGFSDTEINKMFQEKRDEQASNVDTLAATFASGGQVTE